MRVYRRDYDGFSVYGAIDSDGYIKVISFDDRSLGPVLGLTAEEEEKDPVAAELFSQLEEYFEGRRQTFDLPLKAQGTEFQQKVWQALTEIPYGETRTYGEIAEAVGNPKGARAVGMANNKNPLAIVVPCHRVIGADGSLTGYAGGLTAKEKLLALEKYGRRIHKNNTI